MNPEQREGESVLHPSPLPPHRSIEECAYVFWTGAVAVKNLGETVEPFAIHKSPTFAGGGEGRGDAGHKVSESW